MIDRVKHALCVFLAALISFALLTELFPMTSDASSMTGDVSEEAYMDLDEGAKKSTKKNKPKTIAFTPPEGAELKYRAYMHGSGWDKDYTAQGKVIGKPGKSLSIEALQIDLKSDTEGKICYNTYLKGAGWTGQIDGSDLPEKVVTGKPMEKIKIYLAGDLLVKYRVYYRVCIETYGWLGWACDGFVAGNDDYGKCIEAIQIALVEREKGGKAPGNINGVASTTGYYFKDASKIRANMIKKAQKNSSKTNYMVLVDSQYCFLGVFKGKKNHWTLVKFYLCAPGIYKIYWRGTYDLGVKSKGFYSYNSQVYWGTRIHKELWIHSITYKGHNGKTVLDGRLGGRFSHGCIRLATADAKWVYDNVPSWSKCVLYKKKIANVFRPY